MHGETTYYAYDGLRRQIKTNTRGITNQTTHNGLTTETRRYPETVSGTLSPELNTATTTLVGKSTRNLAGTLTKSWSPDPSALKADGSGVPGALALTTTATTYAAAGTTTITNVGGTIAFKTDGTLDITGGHTQYSYTYPDGRTWKTTGALAPSMEYAYSVINSPPTTGLLTAQAYLDGTTHKEITATQTDLAGRTTATGRLSTLTSSLILHPSSFSYNSLGQLDKTIDPDNVTTLYAYNDIGERETTALDLNGNAAINHGTDQITRTSSFPATRGNNIPVLRTETYTWKDNAAVGAPTLTSYTERTATGLDSWSWSIGTTGETHSTTTLGLDRTEITTRPDGTSTETTYANWLPDTTVQYAFGGNPIATTAMRTLNGAAGSGYDGLKRPVYQTDSRTGTTETAYVSSTCDAVLSIKDPGNRTTTFGYDSQGHRLTTTLPDTTVTHTSYHPSGQVKATWGSQTYPVYYQYDHAGRMLTMRTKPTLVNGIPTDDGASLTTWNYDPATGRLQSKIDANGQGPSYTYTNAGRLLTRTNARNITTTQYYDLGGRLRATDYSDSTPDILHTHDCLGRALTATQGTLSIAANTPPVGSGGITLSATLRSLTQTYDADNLTLATESLDYGGGFTKTLTRTYEDGTGGTLAGRPNGYTFTGGSATWGYDNAGRPSTVTDGINTFTYGYLANSGLIETVTKSGTPVIQTTNQWEPTRNVLLSKTNTNGGTQPLSKFTYDVNNIGQRQTVATTGSAFTAAPANWTWHYDDLGQLDTATASAAANNRAYSFDIIGNRLTATANTDVTSYWANDDATGTGANRLNQYGSISYPNVTDPVVPTYDFDGNMLTGPVAGTAGSSVGVPAPANAALTWDAENRLIKAVVGATTVNFAYDHLSRLISRSVGISPTSATHYLYDGWNRIAEYSGTTLERSYLWGMDISGSMQGAGGVGGLLAIVDATGGARHYPTYDGNGNVSEYINAAGTQEAHFAYDPFGNLTADTSGNAASFPYRFSTKPQDPVTGLLYYAYRYYDPLTGRWPSRDPIGERGGINLYGFVGNSGPSYFDNLGMWKDLFRANSSRWAMICAEEGDTWSKLAKLTLMEESEAEKWVKNWEVDPIAGKRYLIPNVFVYYQTKSVGSASRANPLIPDGLNVVIERFRGWGSNTAKMMERKGWKVIRHIDGDSRSLFISSWKEEGIGQIAFSGHGNFSDGEGGFVAADMDTANAANAHDRTLVSAGDVNPEYKLGVVMALSCWSYEANWRRHRSSNGLSFELKGVVHIWDFSSKLVVTKPDQ